MNVLVRFYRNYLSLAKHWQLWMVFLLSVNLFAPFIFLNTFEAKVVLIGCGISLVTITTLFAKLGYVRLLSLGHFPWLFTVPWLYSRLGQTNESGLFYYWLLAVVVLDSISLTIDTVNVIRYWRGERQPIITEYIS